MKKKKKKKSDQERESHTEVRCARQGSDLYEDGTGWC